MSSESLEGKAKNGAGAEARADDIIGATADQIARSADKARAVIADAADQAADAYGELRERAQKVADTVGPFVNERPYAALAIAAVAGLILGALFFSSGPKVIYVKPART